MGQMMPNQDIQKYNKTGEVVFVNLLQLAKKPACSNVPALT